MWVLVVLVLAGIILYLWSQLRADSKVDQLLHRTIEGNNITEQWRRSDSAQVTQASANYITVDDLRHSSNAVIDTLRRELVGPVRTLERSVKIIATRVEELAIPVRDTILVNSRGDTLRGFTFNYSKPPYLQYMSGFVLGDSLHINYGIRSQYTLETHWKKTGLFKPKELELIITNPDPAVTVDRVQQFHIVSKVPLLRRPGFTFGTGVLAGLGVSLLVK